jgi:replicative DNA helicase
MKVERKKFDAKKEFDLITGMIVSDEFMKEIHPIFSPKLLTSPAAKLVARWCIEYYQKYSGAPKQTIQDLFRSKSREGKLEEADVEIIEKFLETINKRYEDNQDEVYNYEYYLDQSSSLLAERKLVMLTEDIKSAIVSGKIDEAEASVAKHIRTERPQSACVDIISDKESIIEVLTAEDDVLIKFPGAVGEMIGDLCRGDFFSIIAPMKRGKTHWLLEFGLRGVYRQCKVLFISLEMPKKAMLKRAYQSIMAQPKREMQVDLPFFSESGTIESRMVGKEGISSKKILKKADAMTTFLKSGGGFRLMCRPANSVNVQDVKAELHNLEHYDNFVPDIIIFDYADIMAAEEGSSKEYRHKIDHTWKALRGLAQERNALVITASQSTREGFNKDVDESGVAEDIRKLAHVTHMMTLNQSKEEKKRGIMRISMLANRNEEFQTDDEVVCLYNYSIGKPFLHSRWKNNCVI